MAGGCGVESLGALSVYLRRRASPPASRDGSQPVSLHLSSLALHLSCVLSQGVLFLFVFPLYFFIFLVALHLCCPGFSSFRYFDLFVLFRPTSTKMRVSTILVSTLAVATSAAPTFPDLNLNKVINPDDTLDSLSEYFNLLATRVQLAKVQSEAPTCDISQAQMPQGEHTRPCDDGGEPRKASRYTNCV